MAQPGSCDVLVDMDKSERIVAVGLLTEEDLRMLGGGFRRSYPVRSDATFDDLLQAIDRAELAHIRAAVPKS